jgi:glucose/arabinose dehydrogenase/mono/diheme cytochrome c family protein
MLRYLSVAALLPALCFAQSGDKKDHANMDPVVPANLVPPAPVLSVDEALKTFKMAPGFVIEAYAAEPLVDKPVAIDYDPAGRMWICEMIGYMPDIDGKGEDIPQGRIVVVEDTDGDGKADKRTVFLEKLLLPRAVAVFPDGILFTDNSNLLWIKRDGLKPVGQPEVAATDFIEAGNVEHKSNGLMHGLDNWLYNAKSGKRVRRINGKWVMENTIFRGQWGIAKDNYGRLYHNHNSAFLYGDNVAPNLLQGNPGVTTKVGEFSSIGSNATWPIRVTPGVNRAYISKKNGYGNDTLDPDTHKLINCTAAAGMTVYRGTNFPAEWANRALVTESCVQLVKAIEINDSGNGKLSGSHPYGKDEWLASTDERFRPVSIYNAPDGSVIVVDMYHGIIQHKTFVTSYLREQYVSRGLDGPAHGQGRLYRVRHEGGKLEAAADLDKLSGTELVKLLGHANGWHRDTAQRVLVDRADASVAPQLEQVVAKSDNPLARIHALWTLEGLGKLSPAAIEPMLAAKDPKVVISGLWAATKLPNAELQKLAPSLLKLEPANEEMKPYIARVLGPLATPEAWAKLTTLVSTSEKNPLVLGAAFSGLDHHELKFKEAAGDKIKHKDFLDWLVKGASNAPAKKTAGELLKGEDAEAFKRGKGLYNGEAACFGCHGLAGEGVPNLGPPLDGSEWVTGDINVFAKILLHGLTGPIKVHGKTYISPADMPGLFQNPLMTDAKLADIATYVRNEWSNAASPIKAEAFTKAREATKDRNGKPYTEAELKK